MTLSSRAASAALVVAGLLCFSSVVYPVENPAPVSGQEIFDLVQQGRSQLENDKPAEALRLLERAIAKPGFKNTEPALQHFALLVASYAAQGSGNYARAHELLVEATRFPNADAELWTRRAQMAGAVGKWDDVALSLTTVAKKWPKQLQSDDYTEWLTNKAVRELGKQPALHNTRSDLINALFDAGLKTKYGTEYSYLWLIAATDALEKKDLKRARELTRRITDSTTLIAMRIDKRFDPLTSSEPKLFDVQAAAERELREAKSAMAKKPKSLGAVMIYGYAQHTLGQFEEMLTLADGIISRVEKTSSKDPVYEDLDDHLNWIYNHKATALRALGRWDEAAATLIAWNNNDRNKEDKVSQGINLGFFYNEMGKPEDALKAVASMKLGENMSEYGSTQYQFVRFQAYLQLNKTAEVEAILAWMREHKDDSLGTAQDMLLESGDVDGAAGLFIARLNDANERAMALESIQHYARTPRTERQKKADELKETMLERQDVTAAIEQYGRREKFSIYSLEY